MWLHRFSVLVAFCTLFLIFAGGMVTSTGSGLAVPDWPLSYGRLMPPMIGGIFYEHGHRMVATLVGFLTILLAVSFHRLENRLWLKKAAWIALGLVVLQGLFGGLTVLLRLPKPVSILHACLAQTFFSLVTALAVWTSPAWQMLNSPRTDVPGKWPLHHITTGLFAALYVQLILGALLRHTGHGFIFHVAGALISFTLGIMAFRRTRNEKTPPSMRTLAALILGGLLLQISLGIITYLLLMHEFQVIPPPVAVPITISLHVVTGAFLLAASVVLALLTHRTKPNDAPTIKTKLSDYVELTKPGISIMAGVTALAGFVLGSGNSVDFLKLIHATIGTLLIAGGAGTLNMLIEKDTDARMKRTKRRPLPAGRLGTGEVLFLGTLLSTFAIAYLAWSVNVLTALVAGFAFSIYLYIYTPLKKVSSICTLAGAVAGALPPVIGWAAAKGRIGIEAWVLFGIIFFWQFPHFFSLAWLYKDDYEQAGLHMMPRPSDHGATAAISMLLNSVTLLIVSLLPTAMGLTGAVYFIGAMAGGLWLIVTSALFLLNRSVSHARHVFFASLAYVPLIVAFMVLNRIS